jgi:hypothetical protein
MRSREGKTAKSPLKNRETLAGVAHFDVSRILETWKLCLQSLIRYRFERLEPSAAVKRFERLELPFNGVKFVVVRFPSNR